MIDGEKKGTNRTQIFWMMKVRREIRITSALGKVGTA